MHSLETIQHGIAAAATQAGRAADSVQLIGVSKRQPLDRLHAAYDAGLRDFGENQAQEMARKVDELAWADATWHFIGVLQRNKVKLVVPRCQWIHSVDSLRLAETIARLATTPINCCVQVNVGCETQKAGVAPEQLQEMLRELATFETLRVRGLMCIPPAATDPETSRPHFRHMRALLERANAEGWYTEQLTALSMGMSHDFTVAIAEGATMVRVGSALFGQRDS